MSAFVMSDEYPKLCKAIEIFGYDIIPSDKILQFNTPEQRHIDMQMLKINNDIFLLKECNNLKRLRENKDYNIILARTILMANIRIAWHLIACISAENYTAGKRL